MKIDSDFYIDSARFVIDSALFNNINIPQQYLLITSDNSLENSEIIREFKEKSFIVKYYKTNVYINRIVRNSKKLNFDKIILLLSSKSSIYDNNNNYFFGIQEKTIKTILLYLRSIGILKFNYSNLTRIITKIKVRDIDIKQDFVFKNFKYDQKIQEFKNLFNWYKGIYKPIDKIGAGVKIYNNGRGFQVNHRSSATFSRPFFKIYFKSYELKNKENIEFYDTFTTGQKYFIENNQIVRFEFTIKDVKFLEKFNIKDTFLDVLYNLCDYKKMKEIKRHFINANFFDTAKESRITNKKFKPVEQIIINLIYMMKMNYIHNKNDDDFKEFAFKSLDNSILAASIMNFTGTEKTRQKQRMERLVYYVNANFERELKEKEMRIKKELNINNYNYFLDEKIKNVFL